MTEQEQKTAIGYFDNEKGDVTLTHYDTPIAICQNQESAIRIINSFKSQSLRISVLEKMNDSLRSELAEKEKDVERYFDAHKNACIEVGKYRKQNIDLRKLCEAADKVIESYQRHDLLFNSGSLQTLKESLKVYDQLKNTKPGQRKKF